VTISNKCSSHFVLAYCGLDDEGSPSRCLISILPPISSCLPLSKVAYVANRAATISNKCSGHSVPADHGLDHEGSQSRSQISAPQPISSCLLLSKVASVATRAATASNKCSGHSVLADRDLNEEGSPSRRTISVSLPIGFYLPPI